MRPESPVSETFPDELEARPVRRPPAIRPGIVQGIPDRARPMHAAAGTVASSDFGRIEVLLVEDDQELRTAIRKLLGNEGFHVAEAGDGARGLEYLNRGNVPSLVILDLLMPGVDGFQFITRMRSTASHREIPILVLSGATRGGLLAGLQGVVAHLAKPFSAGELIACVRKFAAPPRG